MKCKSCGVKYKRWSHEDFDSHLCIKCNEAKWKEFEAEHEDDYVQIQKLMSAGHKKHCACRMVWGDGECECGTEAKRKALR